MTSLLTYFLGLFCGATIPFALAPFNFFPLLIVAIIGIFYLLSRLSSPKQASILGWCFGFGLFGTGASWIFVSIHEYGPTPVLLAVILTGLFAAVLSLFFALQFYLYQRFFHTPSTFTAIIHFSALWILFEWLRSWILTGFPWLYLGYASLDTYLQHWAPIIGVYGLSFLWLITSLMIFYSFSLKKYGYLIVPVVIWLAGFGFSFISWGEKVSNERVALVQGDIPQSAKWDPKLVQQSISTYETLSEPHWGKVDLIIWPESAIPLLQVEVKPLIDHLSQLTQQYHTAFMSGLPFWEQLTDENREGNIYNSVLAISSGEQHYYHKQKLVPFGEYVPFEHWLRGIIGFFDLPMSAFSKGAAKQELLPVNAGKIAPYICYEIVYPDFVAKYAKNSGLIVTISNDTWFGHSIGPHQHFQMVRMRALENARYVLRATNNGITAIINQRGDVVEQMPQFIKGVLSGQFEWRNGNTLYSLTGSWPMLILCLGLLIVGKTRTKKH